MRHELLEDAGAGARAELALLLSGRRAKAGNKTRTVQIQHDFGSVDPGDLHLIAVRRAVRGMGAEHGTQFLRLAIVRQRYRTAREVRRSPSNARPPNRELLAADDLATNAYGERALIHDHTLCAERKRGAGREQ